MDHRKVEQFEERHPVGSKARLAFALLLYTGQRRSDIVSFGRQHIKDGWLSFTQVKNRNRKPVTLSIPVRPELKAIIDATPSGNLTYLVTVFGKPFTANGFGGEAHRLVEADVMAWLAHDRGRYDLIYVDPPSFSNSKRAEDFDVQRDHARLLGLCAARLAPGGRILFSNNLRRFRLDPALAERLLIEDITTSTIPFDFARNQRIHHCFELRLR